MHQPPQTTTAVDDGQKSPAQLSAERAPKQAPLNSGYTPPAPSYLFEYVLDPIYEVISRTFPPWLTPNTITVIGVTSTIFASLIYFAFVLYPVTNDSVTGLAAGAGAFSGGFDLRPLSLEQYGQFNSRFDAKKAANWSSPALPDAFFYNSACRNKDASSSSSSSPLQAGAIFVVSEEARWLLILIGCMKLLYMVCDNTDGKQARRYKMCSNVGEYLDHGMDSVVFPISVFVLSTALFERIALSMYVQCWFAVLVVMTHSVNYTAGIMIWGNRWISVDEGTLLFSVGPLLVGFFDHMAERVFPFGGLRVVQVVYIVLVLSQLETFVKYIKAEPRIVRNQAFLVQIAASAAITVFAISSAHQGGASENMRAVAGSIHRALSPYAEWDLREAGPVFGFVAALIKIGCMFVRNLLTCYPAMVGLAIALITSVNSHIAVAAKVLYYERESWTPQAIVLFGVIIFYFHPPAAVLGMIALHGWQIRYNIFALLSPAHTALMLEKKGKK